MAIPTAVFSAPELRQRCQTGSSVFLGLDYDGTLVPITPHPDDARPTETVLARLSQLVHTPSTTVAVISGRPLEELRVLLPIQGMIHVGTHGLEIALPTGEVKTLLPAGATSLVMVRIRQAAESLVADKPGLFVENKRHAVALHYRLAHPDIAHVAIAHFVSCVRHFQRQGAAIEVVRGKKVVEVRPVGVNKGKALQVLLTNSLRGCLPLYIGDDTSDADAFQAVNHVGGISIVVAEQVHPSVARYYLHDTEEVHRFLTYLLSVRPHHPSGKRHW